MVTTMHGRQSVDLVGMLTGKEQVWKLTLSPEEWTELIFEVLRWIDTKHMRGFKPLHALLAYNGEYLLKRVIPLAAFPKKEPASAMRVHIADILDPPCKWENFPQKSEGDRLLSLRNAEKLPVVQDALFLARNGTLDRVRITWMPQEEWEYFGLHERVTRWATLRSIEYHGTVTSEQLTQLIAAAAPDNNLAHKILHALWLRVRESNEVRRSELRSDEKTEERLRRMTNRLGIL